MYVLVCVCDADVKWKGHNVVYHTSRDGRSCRLKTKDFEVYMEDCEHAEIEASHGLLEKYFERYHEEDFDVEIQGNIILLAQFVMG